MGIFKDLEEKRVVITGGASGIGLATAQRFVNEGAKVVIFDWNEKALDKNGSSAVQRPHRPGCPVPSRPPGFRDG